MQSRIRTAVKLGNKDITISNSVEKCQKHFSSLTYLVYLEI